MLQHILVRGKTNKLLEKTERMRNGEPGPHASKGNLTPRMRARELASRLCHSTVSTAWTRAPVGFSKSRCGRAMQGRSCLAERGMCIWGGGANTSEKYCAVLGADGTS